MRYQNLALAGGWRERPRGRDAALFTEFICSQPQFEFRFVNCDALKMACDQVFLRFLACIRYLLSYRCCDDGLDLRSGDPRN